MAHAEPERKADEGELAHRTRVSATNVNTRLHDLASAIEDGDLDENALDELSDDLDELRSVLDDLRSLARD